MSSTFEQTLVGTGAEKKETKRHLKKKVSVREMPLTLHFSNCPVASVLLDWNKNVFISRNVLKQRETQKIKMKIKIDKTLCMGNDIYITGLYSRE